METLRLYKREKLCSVTAIDRLFASREEACAFLAYPLRAVWRQNTARGAAAQFMISVPKKKLRHAVDRVTMRRRIREAYRINRRPLEDLACSCPGIRTLQLAFIYLKNENADYAEIERKMRALLAKVAVALDSAHEG